jgi:hypothetical protein
MRTLTLPEAAILDGAIAARGSRACDLRGGTGRSQFETEVALTRTGLHVRIPFAAGPRGACRPPLGLLERDLGELGASESDHGSLMGDLCL